MNKAEQDFKEWYRKGIWNNYVSHSMFDRLPIEFKWGVYQKFYRPEGIELLYNSTSGEYYIEVWCFDPHTGADQVCKEYTFETPQEAIDKANELYQEQLK